MRWWDGSAWTETTRTAAEVTAPGAARYSLQQAPATVTRGTPVYNPLIWIMALLPILSIATLLTLDVSVLVGSATDPLAMYRDPGYLATLALGWVVYGSSVVLAYFDRKRLLRDGYDRPFHWAWTFFSGGVYVIGRSIIVRRRATRGLASDLGVGRHHPVRDDHRVRASGSDNGHHDEHDSAVRLREDTTSPNRARVG